MNDKLYYQAIARFEKIGPLRLKTLLKRFSNIENIWQASAQDLHKAGLSEQLAQEFTLWRKGQNIQQQWQDLQTQKIQVLTWNDKEYPQRLKEIHDPPHTLFIRGQLPDNDFTLAVVGTRQVTEYGRQLVEQIVRPLAKSGMAISSGLAIGVDALAHQATLKEQGLTIAVLGGGCDQNTIYPNSNRALAQRIVENKGAVISEYPPHTLSLPYHFPRRNRIIAGLARGTLVIEATESSGSLITARHALEQNREVFTIPGDITRHTSKGVNNLLKMGAHPVLEANDVLQVLNLQNPVKTKEILPDNLIEERVLKHLHNESMHIDELAKKTESDAGKLASTLTLMEMKGKVRHIGGMYYASL